MAQIKALPPYDGSFGPVPANDVTNSDLLERYGITKPTLFKRRDALLEKGWLNPAKVGTRLYYPAADVYLLDQCSWWVSKNYSLPEVVAHLSELERVAQQREQEGKAERAGEEAFELHAREGAVDVAAQNTTADLVVQNLQSALPEEFWPMFKANMQEAMTEAVKAALPRDALAAYDFLAKAAERGYVLTAKVLAEGTGLSPRTIPSWDTDKDMLGFRLTRISRGSYKVRKLNDEEFIEAARINEEKRAA